MDAEDPDTGFLLVVVLRYGSNDCHKICLPRHGDGIQASKDSIRGVVATNVPYSRGR